MRKKIITACLAVMFACLLWLVKGRWSSPAVQRTEHGGLRMGLFQAEPLTPWEAAQIKSSKEAAGGRGAQLIYHTPKEESLGWQIEDIHGLLDSDIDYLILTPGVRDSYDQVLLEAEQRGVPVIPTEQDVKMEPGYDREDYTFGYAASNYCVEGELRADILARHFGVESCHTMVIRGEKSSATDWGRYMGLMHGVRKHPNLYVSKRMESSGNRLTAQKVTESVTVDQDVDFNTVFAQSDEDGLGVLQALKLVGMEPGEDMVIVSIGGIQDVFKTIIAREYLTMVRSSPEYGDVASDIINRYQRGKKSDRQTMVGHREYTMDNAGELFEDAYQGNHKGLHE